MTAIWSCFIPIFSRTRRLGAPKYPAIRFTRSWFSWLWICQFACRLSRRADENARPKAQLLEHCAEFFSDKPKPRAQRRRSKRLLELAGDPERDQLIQGGFSYGSVCSAPYRSRKPRYHCLLSIMDILAAKSQAAFSMVRSYCGQSKLNLRVGWNGGR